MLFSRFTVLAVLAATSLLTACDYGAEPIITGNDRVVTSGGLGGMAGGAVSTLPQQNGVVVPAEGSMMAPAPVTSSSSSLPMPSEAPAVPVETVVKGDAAPVAMAAPQPAGKGCDYIDLLGKPLADKSVTDLIKQGKVVRELKPGDAVTMEYLENRVNIIVDPATKNVIDVTCG